MPRPKGISLHIGVNAINPAHYGTDGLLRGCENDARAMQGIAATLGYQSTILLTAHATSARVLSELNRAAATLQPGDTFFVTYAGHGSQIPDTGGEESEPDGRDETWCLYDRMLIDDELYRCWALLLPGVRVILVSDSCHSGTVARVMLSQPELVRDLTSLFPTGDEAMEFTPRVLPEEYSAEAFEKSRSLYQSIKFAGPSAERTTVAASVVLMSGCQDNQLSSDGPANGRFTSALLRVWNNGAFRGNYRELHKSIAAVLPPTQTPNYFTVGTPNPEFEAERVFTVASPRHSPSPVKSNHEDVMNRLQQLPTDERVIVSDLEHVITTLRGLQESLGGNATRSPGNGGGFAGGCKMEVDIDRSVLGMNDHQFETVIRTQCCEGLIEAFRNARSINTPRGGGGEVRCDVDKGGIRCGVSIRF